MSTTDNSFTPVAYEYREIIAEAIERELSGKIFFWSDGKVDEVIRKVISLDDIPGKGMFITLDSTTHVRIDRIITLFGKPGAAYDEYDTFTNQCLSCRAGVPL